MCVCSIAFKQPPTKPKFEDPIRAGMGQPLFFSLKNNVRCSPNPFFLRSVSSQLHIHACVMLESLCQVVENCLCKRYVPLGPGMLGVLVQACGELLFGAGGGLTQFFAVVIVACIHVSCKKVLFGPGGLGGKCIDKLNLLLFCVNVCVP